MLHLDLTELDPGIRAVVALLRAHGFDTTDSGDGRSKVDAIAAGEAEDVPHVYMAVLPRTAIRESHRLFSLLGDHGVDVVAMGGAGPTIQLSYDPADGTAVLSLYDLDDASLARAKEPSR